MSEFTGYTVIKDLTTGDFRGMHPDFYGELFISGFFVRRYFWRLRNYQNRKIVCRSSGGKDGGYATAEEAARMFDRIFEERWPLDLVVNNRRYFGWLKRS